VSRARIVTPFIGTGLLLAAAGVVVALDQLTKVLAMRRFSEERSHMPSGHAGVRPHMSCGGAFVLLPPPQALLLWLLATCCVESFLVSAPLSAMCVSGLGLAVGGASGNLTDRLVRGRVVDFVAIGRWPVFNLADVAMVLGLGLSSWTLL
jgi:signal peptidase II